MLRADVRAAPSGGKTEVDEDGDGSEVFDGSEEAQAAAAAAQASTSMANSAA